MYCVVIQSRGAHGRRRAPRDCMHDAAQTLRACAYQYRICVHRHARAKQMSQWCVQKSQVAAQDDAGRVTRGPRRSSASCPPHSSRRWSPESRVAATHLFRRGTGGCGETRAGLGEILAPRRAQRGVDRRDLELARQLDERTPRRWTPSTPAARSSRASRRTSRAACEAPWLRS